MAFSLPLGQYFSQGKNRFWVNQVECIRDIALFTASFGGFKWSGLGVENGPWGLAGFTELQVQYRAKG